MVPDFRNRSIWGVSSTDTLGYIEGAIPNVTGSYVSAALTNGSPKTNGALYSYSSSNTSYGQAGASQGIGFDASRCSNLYKSVSYVQPTSLAVRVKCRAK